VQNYGTATVTVAQQFERLKALVLKPKDIVVFYDGVNDIYQGVFYANPEETMIERNRRAVAEVSPVRRVLFALYLRGEKWSSLVRCCDPTDRSVPPHFATPAFLDQLVASLELRYKETIGAAAAHATKSRARFYHFLQPHLFATETLSEYEEQLVQNPYIVPRGLKEAFQKGYPALKAAIRQLPEAIPSYDLTEILNKRPSDSEYFLGSCHVNHEANRVVAAAIFGYIHRDLKEAMGN
jgi:lysophospholipase L1-like esterase